MSIYLILHDLLEIDDICVQRLLLIVFDIALLQQSEVLANISQYDEVTIEGNACCQILDPIREKQRVVELAFDLIKWITHENDILKLYIAHRSYQMPKIGRDASNGSLRRFNKARF